MSASEQVATATTVLRSLIYLPAAEGRRKSELKVLDQLLLPSEMVYVDVPNIQTTWQVIHKMQIRGAPLIAIVAVLGLSVDLQNESSISDMEQIETMNMVQHSASAVLAYIQGKMDYIATSRPTAVNLFNALQEVKEVVLQAKNDATSSAPPRERMVRAVTKHAEFMLQRDEADCRAIGGHGATEILLACTEQSVVTVMTICNTGSLATAAYGTALGVVRAIHAQGKLGKVVALETRPYNQGSRLTCFECLQDELPGATLICDSMAAAFMKLNTVAACVVGADRVAANGDTANKIGTYQLAVAAAAHGVPFYVAAPFTTLDVHTASGDSIPIEERPAAELLITSNAPTNMPVWNPAYVDWMF